RRLFPDSDRANHAMRSPGSNTADRSSRATTSMSWGEQVKPASRKAAHAVSAVRLVTNLSITLARTPVALFAPRATSLSALVVARIDNTHGVFAALQKPV